MKPNFDCSKARRGAVITASGNKTRRSGRKQKIGNIEHRKKVHPTQEERQRLTLEALADVDAGCVIDQGGEGTLVHKVLPEF